MILRPAVADDAKSRDANSSDYLVIGRCYLHVLADAVGVLEPYYLLRRYAFTRTLAKDGPLGSSIPLTTLSLPLPLLAQEWEHLYKE
jgi:hypothetical protein